MFKTCLFFVLGLQLAAAASASSSKHRDVSVNRKGFELEEYRKFTYEKVTKLAVGERTPYYWKNEVGCAANSITDSWRPNYFVASIDDVEELTAVSAPINGCYRPSEALQDDGDLLYAEDLTASIPAQLGNRIYSSIPNEDISSQYCVIPLDPDGDDCKTLEDDYDIDEGCTTLGTFVDECGSEDETTYPLSTERMAMNVPHVLMKIYSGLSPTCDNDDHLMETYSFPLNRCLQMTDASTPLKWFKADDNGVFTLYSWSDCTSTIESGVSETDAFGDTTVVFTPGMMPPYTRTDEPTYTSSAYDVCEYGGEDQYYPFYWIKSTVVRGDDLRPRHPASGDDLTVTEEVSVSALVIGVFLASVAVVVYAYSALCVTAKYVSAPTRETELARV